MSNDIVKAQHAQPAPRPGGALSLGAMTAHEAWKFAEALAGSGMLPRQYQGKPASVLWALEYGRAIGLDVITTTQSVHVIQGRATASADLMASLTRRAGHRMRITSTDERAEVVIVRADDPEFEFRVEWTMQRAQRANLLSRDTWQQYPAAMLRARAISECVRMACPEVLHGCIYTPEEIGARVDADGVPLDAEVQQLHAVETEQQPAPAVTEPTAAQEIADRAAKATTRDEVTELGSEAQRTDIAPDTRIVAPDTGKPDTLRAYLARRWKALPKHVPQQDSGEPVDAEIVPDTPADEHTQAVAELRAAAQRAGLDNVDEEFHASYGLPIAEAGIASIREMTQILARAS